MKRPGLVSGTGASLGPSRLGPLAALGAMRDARRMVHVPLLLLLLAGTLAAVELQCQIFDETMICDDKGARLARAEIRTCSG